MGAKQRQDQGTDRGVREEYRMPFRLLSTSFSSRTPSLFPFLFSLQHPLFSSLFSRENSVEIVNFGGSEPSPLRLFWGQNQQNRQNTGNFAEKTREIRFPQFCRRFCPIGTSSQTQGNSRVSRMEHQNTLCFPSKFPETQVLGNLSGALGVSVFLFVCRKSLYRPSLLPVLLYV